MKNIVIGNIFITPETSIRYCTWSDESTIGREVQKWLGGKEITVHVDETLFTEDLQLSRTLKPVSDDAPTPPDDGGFDFGGGEDNQASVTLEITA